MTIKISPITEHDINGYHQLLDIVARERQYISFLKAPQLEHTKAFILHSISQNYPQFVAKINEQIIGWCDALPKNQEIYSHSAILGMGVLPEFRKNGVGTALIEATLKKAFEQKIIRIELAVFSDNQPAIQLYKNFGFIIEGELKNDVRIDDQFKNSLVMAIVRK